jgi:hypothetical protein
MRVWKGVDVADWSVLMQRRYQHCNNNLSRSIVADYGIHQQGGSVEWVVNRDVLTIKTQSPRTRLVYVAQCEKDKIKSFDDEDGKTRRCCSRMRGGWIPA